MEESNERIERRIVRLLYANACEISDEEDDEESEDGDAEGEPEEEVME